MVITLRGFHDLESSVTPMGRFLYQFSTFCEKIKKIYRVEIRVNMTRLDKPNYMGML